MLGVGAQAISLCYSDAAPGTCRTDHSLSASGERAGGRWDIAIRVGGRNRRRHRAAGAGRRNKDRRLCKGNPGARSSRRREKARATRRSLRSDNGRPGTMRTADRPVPARPAGTRPRWPEVHAAFDSFAWEESFQRVSGAASGQNRLPGAPQTCGLQNDLVRWRPPDALGPWPRAGRDRTSAVPKDTGDAPRRGRDALHRWGNSRPCQSFELGGMACRLAAGASLGFLVSEDCWREWPGQARSFRQSRGGR